MCIVIINVKIKHNETFWIKEDDGENIDEWKIKNDEKFEKC